MSLHPIDVAAIIVSTTGALVLVIAIAIGIFLYLRRRRRSSRHQVSKWVISKPLKIADDDDSFYSHRLSLASSPRTGQTADPLTTPPPQPNSFFQNSRKGLVPSHLPVLSRLSIIEGSLNPPSRSTTLPSSTATTIDSRPLTTMGSFSILSPSAQSTLHPIRESMSVFSSGSKEPPPAYDGTRNL